MGLNIARGNMYEFITHTWNTIKGKCPHNCSYCYMKKFPQKDARFDEQELKTDLGKGNFIFVGSSCDMWAEEISGDWIYRTLYHCDSFRNKYLFQTKNPNRFMDFNHKIPAKSILCTTIETNREYNNKYTPHVAFRAYAMKELLEYKSFQLFLTIEPIMDFDIEPLVIMIKSFLPAQVNIGADSGNNHLPEPSSDKIRELISKLSKFTKVVQKSNLSRLLV